MKKELHLLRSKLLDHDFVAVIDLEATCYTSPSDISTFENEVIEIGWVLCNIKTGDVTDKQSFYVKPTTSYVSYFCTELTGITPEQVANAPSFRDTMAMLKAHHELHGVSLWLSHGNYDRAKLIRQCASEGVDYPFEDQEWINIKTVARHTLGRKNRLGLKSLIEDLGLDFEGTQHCGADDAYNSAKVLLNLLSMN